LIIAVFLVILVADRCPCNPFRVTGPCGPDDDRYPNSKEAASMTKAEIVSKVAEEIKISRRRLQVRP
jgi:hypothetical protein